jgi:hypothetical protein
MASSQTQIQEAGSVNEQAHTPKRRGPYRNKKRTPRQTRYNRLRCLKSVESVNAGTLSLLDVSAMSSVESPVLTDETATSDVEPHIDSENPSVANDYATNVSGQNSCQENSIANDLLSPSLYSSSVLTVNSSNIAVSSFILRHQLTKQAQQDLLQLLSLHLPSNTEFPSSLYKFRKNCEIYSNGSVQQFLYSFCPSCYAALESDSLLVCSNSLCGISLSKETTPNFHHLSISDQIINLVKRPDIFQSVQKHFSSQQTQGIISDVYDGEICKSLAMSNVHCPNKIHVTAVLNTDGVSIFKSKNQSLWPVLLMLNELSFPLRRQPKNMILCGLWFAMEKPIMNLFMKPIVQELQQLETDGVHVISKELSVKVYLHVIAVSCDLPARALVQNFIQFNGLHGCSFCEQSGKSFPTDKGGTVHVYLQKIHYGTKMLA